MGKGRLTVSLSFWPSSCHHVLIQGGGSGGLPPKVVPVVPSDLELGWCPFSQGADWVSQVNAACESPKAPS